MVCPRQLFKITFLHFPWVQRSSHEALCIQPRLKRKNFLILILVPRHAKNSLPFGCDPHMLIWASSKRCLTVGCPKRKNCWFQNRRLTFCSAPCSPASSLCAQCSSGKREYLLVHGNQICLVRYKMLGKHSSKHAPPFHCHNCILWSRGLQIF